MIFGSLKRSARYPEGMLASARITSRTHCKDPNCVSLTLKCWRNSGTRGFSTCRSAKLTKLIKASTARRRACSYVNGIFDAIASRFPLGRSVRFSGAPTDPSQLN
jgi:hypothetical protein